MTSHKNSITFLFTFLHCHGDILFTPFRQAAGGSTCTAHCSVQCTIFVNTVLNISKQFTGLDILGCENMMEFMSRLIFVAMQRHAY